MSNTILIMCGSERTGFQLRQILSTMDECPEDSPGKHLMQRLLRSYFLWKGGLGKLNNTGSQTTGPEASGSNSAATTASTGDTGAVNEALKRKAMAQRGPNAAVKRRRQRGGASGSAGGRFNKATDANGVASFEAEAAQVSKL